MYWNFPLADNPAPKLSLEVSSNEFFILGVHLSYIIMKQFHLKLIEWVHLAKTEQNWCNFLLWGAASLRLTVLSTDTGLAVGTAEHFYTCYHEAIYVGIKEANGYTTIFDVWAD